MLCRDEIKRILNDGVDLARAEYETARVEFMRTVAEIPSSLPPPDGTGWIRIAGESYRLSMRAYSTALREFNDFVLEGRIPDRLTDQGKAAGG